MTKSNKAVETAKPKTNIKQVVLGLADKVARIVAAIFLIATSYGYVEGWLKLHQTAHNISQIGAILLVTIALYLYCHKQ